MARKDLHTLRLTISKIDADGNEQKRGGRYDLDMNEHGVPDMSNQEIASIFAAMANTTVLYELGEHDEVSN